LAVQGSLSFCRNFQIVFSISVKNIIGILTRIAFSSIAISTILFLQIHGHRKSSIFWCPLQYLFAEFYSLYCYVPSRCFYVEADMHRTVFLISFSPCTLLVHKKGTDFCTFIFTLLLMLKMYVRSEFSGGAFLSSGSYHLQREII
jgi:hypothetical protein